MTPTPYTPLTKDYLKFIDEIRQDRRFFLSDRSLVFLEKLLHIAHKKPFKLNKGTEVFRARSHQGASTENGFKPDLTKLKDEDMLPRKNLGAEGRANPYNLCVLYLASSEETAIAEIRPGVKYPVKVTKFISKRNLKLVDFVTTRPGYYNFFFPKDPEEAWLWISNAFTTPVKPNEERLNYLHTQILAEYFKINGFDGLVYQSQYLARKQNSHPGEDIPCNYALFDVDMVERKDSNDWEITEEAVTVRKILKRKS